ncbi:hypothetical protein JAO78_003860 [Alishewanella sp. 16-MA]|uniref:Uncharacterized protein n=1 Tax=Alishewanella maricola TaxID=2795740 RepID=A0ABS8C0U8_9ALTE|nr:hypothetical protein [Alishewanella maricola]MCB5225944.1 hypothetical protein [Alishewanella maricola]
MTMNKRGGLWILLWLVACSGAINAQSVVEPSAQPLAINETYSDDSPEVDENTLLIDCPHFTDLFTLLPDALIDEAISEHYWDCDAVLPTASSTFMSADQQSVWTFSVMALDLDVMPALQRWDRAEADATQKAFFKKALQANIDLQLQLYRNCLNYLEQTGLPVWHATYQANTPRYSICIGSDAQKAEDGLWFARAVTPRYLFTLQIEGAKAAQFATAEAAAEYMAELFTSFR